MGLKKIHKIQLTSVSPGSELVGGASVPPDDDVFVHLAKVYSYNHASMYQGDRCGDSRPFLEGITNGYQWYPLAGQHVALIKVMFFSDIDPEALTF